MFLSTFLKIIFIYLLELAIALSKIPLVTFIRSKKPIDILTLYIQCFK